MARLVLIGACWIGLTSLRASSATETKEKLTSEAAQLQDRVKLLTRHVMMQQFYLESISQTDGDSGITTIKPPFDSRRPTSESKRRQHFDVTPPVHSHPEKRGVLGLADLSVVLNGVHFRMGHTDYTLRSRAHKQHSFDDIRLPPVPPEVTKLTNVEDQIVEMAKWFKAWRNQDHSKRDYRKYFKPVLCYLEGSWQLYSSKQLKKKFRTKSIATVIEQLRFIGFTELATWLNNSHIPLSIMSEAPSVGQWQYNVLCHQLKEDLPLADLKPVDDVENRMKLGGISFTEYQHTDSARFTLASRKKNETKLTDKLDELMYEIPGLDGYSGHITDKIFERTALNYDNANTLNAAFYHRWYRTPDGVGQRSFADSTIFMARNTDHRVLKAEVKYCAAGNNSCKHYAVRTSYAIPLEIIFLTPLHSWDPYALSKRGVVKKVQRELYYQGPNNTYIGNDRIPVKWAFSGSNERHFYMTPSDFFDSVPTPGPADTGSGAVYALDKNKVVRKVVASGVYVHLPKILGVGRLRTRYPVMPLHGEGDPASMELSALTQVILRPTSYLSMRQRDAKRTLCTLQGSGDQARRTLEHKSNYLRTAQVKKEHSGGPAPEKGKMISSSFRSIMDNVLRWRKQSAERHAAGKPNLPLIKRLAKFQHLRGRFALVMVTGGATPKSGSRKQYVVLESGPLSKLLSGKYVKLVAQIHHKRVHPLILYRRGHNYAFRQCNNRGYCRNGHGPYRYRPET